MTYVDPYLQPGPGALTSVQKAQIWLRRNRASGNGVADDVNLLSIAIDGVSEAIRRYTGRQFIPENGATKTFEYDGSGFLNFAPYELRSVTSATLAGQTLTATTGQGDGDYVPMPRNKTAEGTYLYWTTRGYFRLGPSHYIWSPVLKTRDVVITGDWGMPAIPADIELACLIAVDDMYRNPEQAQSRGAGEFQLVEEPRTPGSTGLPAGVVELIDPYKRLHLN